MHLHRRVFTKYFVLQSLHKALITACTEYSPVVLEETPFTSSHPFVTHLNSSVCRKKLLTNRIFCAHKALPTTTLYYKACTEYFPVLLCTTKLAQSTSQYYFVLQSLHKARSSTTLYYKACKNYFRVLLCTTKLAQSTFQYYFVLQSLHRVLPSSMLYYKACTKHFPVLLCTTKLAQSTFQYYFVLQSLHKARSSTTLYYKACTKHVSSTTLYYKACTKYSPVLLCTTKLAQVRRSTTLYYKPCTRYVPVLQYFYTQQVLSQRRFYTQQAF